MSTTIPFHPSEFRAAAERHTEQRRFVEEAEYLSGSLFAFIKAAWPVVEPHVKYKPNWHIEAECEFLEAISRGDIRKGQIWVPPGSMKSILASIMWPAWEWTFAPWHRYLTASYDLELSTRFATRTRDLIQSQWYQARFGERFQMKRDENLKRSYKNTEGGERFATSPTGGGTGRHGTRLIIDDPLNAADADATTDTKLQECINWYDGVLATRAADPKEYVELIIMQRLHESDLAQHVLGISDLWEVLCLPERYERKHPHRSKHDKRKKEGELLWPDRVGEVENLERQRKLGAHRAAGQLQQRPSAREGDLLKRADWRYFDAKRLDREPQKLGPWAFVISSWDTAFKDKTSSDYVVGTVWGVKGADRFLLRIVRSQMSFGATKRAMKEVAAWCRETWPATGLYTVIEKSANGVAIIEELKREITGVKEWVAATDKFTRAAAAQPTLESNNCFLPGAANAQGDDYDPARTPADVQAFVEELSRFDKGEFDDQVDSWSQAMNFANTKATVEGNIWIPEGEI